MSNTSLPPTNPYQSPTTNVPAAVKVTADKPKKAPIPGWAWIFAVACGAIPLMTLGGAIPGAIGFGGAAGCIGLARNAETPMVMRILGCVGITIACYVLVFVVLLGIVAARG